MLVSILGFLAGLTSTLSLVPQLIKTFKTRSSQDLSYGMLWIFLVTSALWIAYGWLEGSTAVWCTNVIMLVFSCALLCMKWRFESAAPHG